MEGVRRLVLVLALLASGCSSDAPTETEPGAPAARPSGPSEPFAYTTPTPPPEPSEVDGDYVRVIDDDLAGAPGKCRRCPPYRLEVAASTLRLHDGVFLIENEVISPKAIDWKSVGHFSVDGDELTIFNDPNCPTTRGTYGWTIRENVLTLEVIDDQCAFGGLRWKYLQRAPWAATSSETGRPGSRSA